MSSHRYLPHTRRDIDLMLERCKATTVDDLFADIPDELRLKKAYDLPGELSEPEVRAYFRSLSAENSPLVCFAGGGFYDRYAPAVIPALMARSEFLTAYTPYQPEISQGTLQYIFEYQSMMCELTGLDVSNASMYDGTTAVAEAMMMCVAAARKRNRVLVSETVSPITLEVMKTYARYHGITISVIPATNGVTDRAAMQRMLADGDVAGVVLASPNYYGILEDYTGFADDIHAAKALMVMTSHACALGVVKSPGEWGADIAAGEAQSLGMPLNYGGPWLGYLCTTNALMRKMPGRIVGATTDAKGQRVFVLTLQAREQHIRREKATSNICSNQGIMTLYASMYCSVMGAEGLRRVNNLSYGGAHSLAKKIEATGLARLKYPDKPFLNEFVVEFDSSTLADMFYDTAVAASILPGIRLGDKDMLIAVTEMRTPDDIEDYISILNDFKDAKLYEEDE
ncbi:MAG: aminomethyl-transferring glycine dehydrogenase subunit GcvPA [Bacteroidales bacterium]|nr:aminomethyl-transferring glycine dehydrogenase subunit GcvPA [Bacteroidales bacterium]